MSDVSFDSRPSWKLGWGVFGFVLLSAVGAGVLYARTDPNLNLDIESFVIFAPIYAAAQALERLLEPLSKIYLPSQASKEKAAGAGAELEQARAVREGVDEAAAAKKIADAELAKRRSERALWFFAIASFFGLALCAVLGLGIITAMAESPPTEYLRAIDIALTGLVIGAGTKPLHDLIAKVEKSKNKAGTEAEGSA